MSDTTTNKNPVEVFNNPYDNTESFSTQGAVIKWGTVAMLKKGTSEDNMLDIPLLMSDIDIAYGRASNPMYPINKSFGANPSRINLHGAASGQLTVGSIYSPDVSTMEDFIKAVTKECKSADDQVIITFRPFGQLDCATQTIPDTTKFTLKCVELNQLRIRIQGGEIAVINMPLTFNFSSLVWDFHAAELKKVVSDDQAKERAGGTAEGTTTQGTTATTP